MAVIKKNLYNLWINKFGLLFMIILPTLCSLFQISVNTISSSGKFTDGNVIEKLERCKTYDIKGRPYQPTKEVDDCRTLIYAPSNNFTDAIMKKVAEWNELEFGEDIVGYNDKDEYVHAIYPKEDSNLRYATAGVYFTRGSPITEYHIWVNSTYANHIHGYGVYEYKNPLAMAIQNNVESAINNYVNPAMERTIIELRHNPYINVQSEDTVFALEWHKYITSGIGLIFTLYWGIMMVNEKKGSMLSYLRSMGMMESSTLLGYLPVFLIFSLSASLLNELFGRMTSDPVYVLYSFGIVTLFDCMFYFSSCLMGMFIFTCVIRISRFAILYIVLMIYAIALCSFGMGSVNHSYDFFYILFIYPISTYAFSIFNDVSYILLTDDVTEKISWGILSQKVERYYVSLNTAIVAWIISTIVMYCYCWYFSYKSMCKEKMFFFLQSSFWKPQKTATFQGDEDSDEDKKKSKNNKSIVFSYTTKLFPTCTAVKELHLEVKKNQIFTLLGPNGCGKTTTVSMLTGVFPPTYGDIYVNGLSIIEHRSELLEQCGVCNQFDYFWPSFTPRQMFQVMGSFKGLSNDVIATECERLLSMFNLTKYIDNNATTFSGGMKRKLSVALACLGDAPLIILDEPTSGMDPVSRSELWEVVLQLKKDHTVLLTTHSMEEADALSDRLGIMVMGHLRAIGSPYSMKQTYGKGYKVDILLNEGHNANDVFDLMKNYMPNTDMINYTTAQLSVGVGRDDLRLLPRFLLDINRLPCTKEWLISPSTLDEVFLKVVEVNRNVQEADEILQTREEQENRARVKICVMCGLNPAEKVTIYNKKGEAFICEGVYCRHCLNTSGSESDQSLTEPPAQTTKQPKETETSDVHSTNQQQEEGLTSPVTSPSFMTNNTLTEPLIQENDKRSKDYLDIRDKEKTSPTSIIGALTWLNWKLTIKDWKRFIIPAIALVCWSLYIIFVGYWSIDNRYCPDGSIMNYGHCIDNENPPDYDPDSDIGYFHKYVPDLYSRSYMNPMVSVLIDESEAEQPLSTTDWPYNLLHKNLSGIYRFKQSVNLERDLVASAEHLLELASQGTSSNRYYEIKASSLEEAFEQYIELVPQLSVKVVEHNKEYLNVKLGFHLSSSPSNTVRYREEYSQILTPLQEHSKLEWITIINNLRLRESAPDSQQLTYIPYICTLDSKTWIPKQNTHIYEFVGITLPFFMIVMAILIVYRVVDDRATDRTRILYLNNVTSPLYVTALLIYNTAYLIAVVCVVFIVMNCLGENFEPTLAFFLRFLWECIHSGSFYVAFAILFKSPVIAVAIAIIINAVAAIPFLPDMGLNSLVYLAVLPGGATSIITTGSMSVDIQEIEAMNAGLWYSIVGTIVYIVSAYVIMYLREDLMNILDRYYQKKVQGTKKVISVDSNGSVNVRDDDVEKEEEYVNETFSSYTPSQRHNISLLVSDVSKVFYSKNSSKRVFPTVSFSIHDKEVFGLLGPNGAGKTTLINILTSKLAPNQGDLKIFGYTYRNSFTIKQLIGVVPQFDIFFDDLTVKEHLELIARLHNIDRRTRTRFGKEIASQVGLAHDSFFYKAGNLSGGQKRRLTLGMALMSRPLLLFLDEPTTGLDLESRMAIWNAVKAIQSNMSILLTTHSMEEADALCTRIAILTNDGLRCIGSQVHLKNKFGRGLMFSVKLDEAIPNVVEYVKTNICNDLEFVEERSFISTFAIAKEKVNLDDFLSRISSLQQKKILLFWSLSQSSLNDVFLRVCRGEE